MDLERELRSLDVAWPATPSFALAAATPRRRTRWWTVVAIAAALAIGVAFAVPQSRGAILRFFHIGADRIEFVDTLPPAQQRALDTGLGAATTLAEARRIVPRLLLPPTGRTPKLHESGGVVSLVFLHRGRPVLLSEVTGSEAFLKKLAGGATNARWLELERGVWGVWLSGAPHVFFFPREPARLAGNTLVWNEGNTTYRLEAPHLKEAAALDLARSLRDTP
jgi:hypothetical protein